MAKHAAKKFKVGDRVVAYKGNTVVIGVVNDCGQGPFIDLPDAWLGSFEYEGFTVELAEPESPRIPKHRK